MDLLQGEAGAVLCDCLHPQSSQGSSHLVLWWQRGITPKAAKVAHILFYGGKEASERCIALKDQCIALKDQVDETNLKDADTVFKAFANSFEKSYSHWWARDKHLADNKQAKHQTLVELDIYIKDLVRKCQFNQTEQKSHKIDLLYHNTAHFKVRKFVHNAKPEELTYDKMIELDKAQEKTCQEYQIHKQAHSMASNYSNPLLQTSALSVFSERPSQEDLWQVQTFTQSQ